MSRLAVSKQSRLAIGTLAVMMALMWLATLARAQGVSEAPAVLDGEPDACGVNLTWDAPTADLSSVTGYRVLRGSDSATLTTLVSDTGTTDTAHSDTTVTPGETYWYGVQALRGADVSAQSTAAEVSVPQRPTATEVTVSAVPIVVPSTTADYFVLYVNDAVAVAVVRGEAGTTTIAENVAALPVDQYRVEKYLVSDPADVDGDCVDDITELEDGVGMSPVNPTGSAFSISVGAAAIPDSATFERLSIEVRGGRLLKFMVMHMHTDRPAVYFSNANSNPSHFQILEDLGVAHESGMFRGSLSYYPNIAAPDGSLGLFYFDMLLGYEQQDGLDGLEDVRRVYALLAANMGVLDDNLAYRIPNSWLSDLRPHLSSFQDSRVNLLYDDEEFPEAPFISLNPGEGYGLLRNMDPDERPRPRDIVIYESLPNELPRVAGILSTVPQTPLSHVNLRAAQDSIPNAYVRDALSDSTISALLDRHVFYRVTEQGWEMRAATLAEVNAHYDSSRPAEVQRLRRVLTPTTTVSPLSSIGFQHCEEFGVKASNLAVLGKLVSSRGLVPDGFAIPFYFYDEFMKHNGFYEQVEEMLADPDFQSSQDEQVKQLKKLRKNIKDGDSPAWIISALTEMHDTYPVGQSLRYRSSTNNEDLPGFNGAGLYDSKTQKPSETEEDGIDKSLKEVYASLWNYRAFAGREFQRIDHLTVAMGVLVHPNFKDELVNGVAVSADPAFGTSGNYYVNSQVGEDLVTNPEAESLPEEILLRDGGAYHVISLSSQAKPGELLLSNTQLSQLRDNLEKFHSHFSSLYNAGTADPFAMEIEFKITSENMLSIKQARPWIFTPPSPATPPDTTDADALTASLVSPPSQHDGSVINLRIDFSHPIRDRYVNVKDYAFEVSGGTVTGVSRVDGRSDQWKVVVTPDSNANVQIVLPARRPCSIAGAICTRDGLRLSNRLELTVVGPDGGGTIDRDAGERTPCSGANEPPLANNDSAATTRDEAVLIDVLSNDTDPNSHALIITEVSSPTKGTAARTAQNMINYTPAPDTDGTDSFSYTVSDGEHSTTATVTVTVDTRIQRPNSEPEFPSSEDGARSVDENTPANRNFGTPIAATDADSDGLTYSIFGGDAALFDVVATSGQLRTKGALNHEGKSSYSFTMSVHDGRDIHNNSDTSVDDTISVTVTVDDVDEPADISFRASGGVTASDNALAVDENHDGALATFTASDPENEPGLIYMWSLGGRDRGDFAITSAGVLSFVNIPDFERPADSGGNNVYDITVSALDSDNNTGTIAVTVTVDPVNEPPTIGGDAAASIEEEGALLIGTYRTADSESAVIAWQPLAGADGDRFEFTASNGRLVFKSAPDYEDATDSGRDNVYDVTLGVSAGGHTTTFDVAVSVTNKEEGGALGLSSPQPQADADYTATLSDPDGVVSTDWTWERSASRSGPWTAVSGATSSVTTSVYRPGAGDVGYFLRVSAAYTDGHGPDKSRAVVSTDSVQAAPVTNVPPSFNESAPTRRVAENARARAAVGVAVTATDTDSGDVVTYELSGSALFTINSGSGQISVVADDSLDHETAPSHRVTVKASDTTNASDAVTVTIEVTDVNERPDAVADTATVTEDGAVAIDVLVNDSDQEDDRSALTLRVTASPRQGSATVNEPANVGERRTITYTPNENYHGSDVFTYEVRDAGSPSLSRTATVSVEVDEVNDPPTFKSAATTRSVSQSATGGAKVGAPVTASDVDDNDTLTYSLSGSEARFFAIGARSGQITVGDGVTFDIATTKDTYTVTVHADDTSFERATVEVTITVTSGPTTPPITGGGGGGGGDPVVVVEIDGPSFAAADTEAVFTAAVSDGTTISALSWTVTGPDGFAATDNAERFSFAAPVGGTYTLSVTIEDTAGGTLTGRVTLTVFGDITAHQFADEILWLAEEGITRGCAVAHSFCPSSPVTRAQMASFLARALDLQAPRQSAGFGDVDPSSAHAANIEALYAAQITTGCNQEPLQYCPSKPVTRAQMASFLARALDLETPRQRAGFDDVDPSSAHAANIEALYAAQITTGCTQDRLAYCPSRPVTRAQMAAFLARALNPATNANPS